MTEVLSTQFLCGDVEAEISRERSSRSSMVDCRLTQGEAHVTKRFSAVRPGSMAEKEYLTERIKYFGDLLTLLEELRKV